MRNPLIFQSVGRLSHIWSHLFRLSLIHARPYARRDLYGSDVTRCDSLPFGSFPWGHALRGTRSRSPERFLEICEMGNPT